MLVSVMAMVMVIMMKIVRVLPVMVMLLWW